MTGPPRDKEAAPPEATDRAASQNTLNLDNPTNNAKDRRQQDLVGSDMTPGLLRYYVDGYPEHVAEMARQLLLARDAYVGAWLDWADTPLGAGDPRDEAAIIERILVAAWEAYQVDAQDDEDVEPAIREPAKPKDATAAERQRRYRARKRNGSGDRDATVTHRDAGGVQ